MKATCKKERLSLKLRMAHLNERAHTDHLCTSKMNER